MLALAFTFQILALINISVNPRAQTGDTFVSRMVTAATVDFAGSMDAKFPMAFGRSRKYIIRVVWKALALHSGFGYRMLAASLNKGA